MEASLTLHALLRCLVHNGLVPPSRRLAAAVCSAALTLAACSGGAETGAGSDVRFVGVTNNRQDVATGARRPAPPLAGRTLSGQQLDLASLRGRVTVVNFWGSWCAPCRAESPGLEQVYAANKARGVAFVGVDERDGLAAARTFTLDKGVTYPSLFDDTGALVTSWPAGPAIPFTFVVDRRGRIASRFTGAVLPSDLQPAVTRAADEP